MRTDLKGLKVSEPLSRVQSSPRTDNRKGACTHSRRAVIKFFSYLEKKVKDVGQIIIQIYISTPIH